VVDYRQVRKEHMRWILVVALNNARPMGCYDSTALWTVQAEYPDAGSQELRRELDYLADTGVIDLRKESNGRWAAKLNQRGVNLAEYNTACEPGIGRPTVSVNTILTSH